MTTSKYTTNNIGATKYGMPISKYYPSVSSNNVIWDDEIELTCDVGSFAKGTKISAENVTLILRALIESISSSASKVEDLQKTIDEQHTTIEQLKEAMKWPDISDINGGDSEDSGENGGTDEVTI